MTQFLDPQRAASKASRKERKQTAHLQDSAATERAVAALKRTMGRDFRKTDNQERLISKAINDTMVEFIAAMDEEVLAPFFFSLERLATPANRRRIAMHPLRPQSIEEMHEEADEEEALAAEEAERAAAKASQDEKTAKPMQKADAANEAAAS